MSNIVSSHENLKTGSGNWVSPFEKQRASPRSPFTLSLHYQIKSRPKTALAAGFLTQWNVSGGRLDTADRLDIGDWVTLQLTPEAVSSDIPIPAPLRQKQWVRGRVVCEISLDTELQENPRYAYGVAFATTAKSTLRFYSEQSIPWVAHGLFTAGIANVIYLKSGNLYYFWYHPLMNLYSLLISIYILSRFVLSYLYRPPQNVGHLPSISVIIACKNEEGSIGRTIDAIYRSDYPIDRMEVISVNDGSTDGTYLEMERAKERHPGLQVIHFEKNKGKRHGMAAGARLATGEVLIYVDSDSFVQRETLRKIVQGFADPTVGAVCGHALVQNARKNLLTKMQEVRYYIAFRVVKAAESVFSAVSCCSGCLAAYRRSAVMEVLDTWLNQRFLGEEATFGDDRSLTNFMLRRYRVLYDSEAVCTTLVPENYRQFFRQQLRWKKSWIRESLIAGTFMWKRHPLIAFFFYLGLLFPLISPLVAFHSFILPLFGWSSVSLLYIYGATLMAGIYSLCYLSRFRNTLWVYGILFSFFYMFVLVWQTYYAFVTVRRNHWGTR
ncbi:MAG: glycosyltransferase [Candidatus Manganitrophaceae bacterium]